ncbi:MAG: hypothetical protein M3123_06960 [Actinomycetota bacterium]|nr:hypothetical protein [Actinomycetota bacterium]
MRRVVIVACLLAALFVFVSPGAARGPLQTAITDPRFGGPMQERAFTRTRAAGATMVRLILNWRNIAPERRSPDFVATDPRDPAYRWGPFDQEVAAARAAGLEPIASVVFAPDWAEGPGRGQQGTVRVDPGDFAAFAQAAARRYSGSLRVDGFSEPLPRIRYWQAWNEPNRDYFLMPQYESGRLVSADRYRAMVNRFASAVRSAAGTNVVVAGGLAPFGRRNKPAPLAFMRKFLSRPARFDVWSHHPYTSGSPTHKAPARDDVSLGDLPEMRRLLAARARAGRVISRGRIGFWVTEFSWDSNPPDPRALPASLHARWVAEALYRMWQHGVSVVTWFRIEDDPLRTSPYQSGFFTVDGRRKRSLAAFRFPVVGFAKRGGVAVWGRTPAGRAGRVVVELKAGRGWRRLATVQTNRYGIFLRTFRTPIKRGFVRARFAGEASLPFSLTQARDRHVNPFGCGGAIRC